MRASYKALNLKGDNPLIFNYCMEYEHFLLHGSLHNDYNYTEKYLCC